MSKYSDVIQKARSQEDDFSGLPENQKTSSTAEKEEQVNLSIKVPKRLRRHWVAEAKRRDTTLTAAIITSLTQQFGEPIDD